MSALGGEPVPTSDGASPGFAAASAGAALAAAAAGAPIAGGTASPAAAAAVAPVAAAAPPPPWAQLLPVLFPRLPALLARENPSSAGVHNLFYTEMLNIIRVCRAWRTSAPHLWTAPHTAIDLSLHSRGRRLHPAHLTDSVLLALAPSVANITTLNLPNCRALTDKGLCAAVDAMPALQHLGLSGCKTLTDAGIRAATLRCADTLAVLDVAYCEAVSSETVAAVVGAAKQLHTLNLFFCRGLTDVVLVALADAPRLLVHLDVSYCKGITDKGVVALATRAGERLKSLRLSNVVKLTDASLAAVAAHCLSLAVLSLLGLGVTPDAIKRCRSAIPRLSQIHQ